MMEMKETKLVRRKIEDLLYLRTILSNIHNIILFGKFPIFA